MNELSTIGVTALYLLALINPISKVAILSAFAAEDHDGRFRALIVKSSLAAAGILFGAMVVGDWLLRSVFRVDLYSLRLAGGVVVFWMGLNALRRGVFFEHDSHAGIEDVALVPLACPMIAGPATIAGCIGLRAHHGYLLPAVAIALALGVNYLTMRYTLLIKCAFGRFNLLGAIIRLTGLIVMTIGTQMALDGLSAWLAAGKAL